MQTETDERWYVQFDSGEVRLMTLEELDGAFEAGEVHENTFVIQVGETQWQTLADVAGLNDEEEEAEVEEYETPAPAVEAETTTLYTAQQAASLNISAHSGPPSQRVTPPVPAQPAHVVASRPPVAAAAGGWPPVATAAAPQSTWPPPALAQSGGYNLGPQSMIPVVNDVDLDFDSRSFKSGRKTALIAAFAVLPALAGGGYMLTRLDTPSAKAAAAAAPAPPPPKTSPWSGSIGASSLPTTPAPAPTPAPAEEAKSDSGATGRLSDDMKKALLTSDSERSPKTKAKGAAPARRAARGSGSPKEAGSVFKSGGNANDPLNSNL